MAGRFFTAAMLFAAAFASDSSTTSSDAGNSTASTFSYSAPADEVANTPATDEYVVPSYEPPQPYGGVRANAYRHGSAWLPWGSSLNPRLSQHDTNGDSKLGTPGAPRLPPWISGDGTPMPQGRPWGPRTCANTDPYKDPPHTGMTRSYDFTISKKIISPDGVNRSAIVINNAFPGPTIEANWGDWISVTVHNSMEEGTALHWHGLLQKETQWMDGVPSVMQCPIAPGSSFTYRFRADLYGTSWYHSHYSAQAAGGLFGPMIIHGPHDNADYDEDLGPVMLSDWYHRDYYDIVKDVMAPAAAKAPLPQSNNNLINGKMNYPCASNNTACTPNAGVSKFKFQSGKTYRIRLINSGAEGLQKFSIDNHTMTIIANDFVPVVPYKVDVVTLGIGQRTDIIVKATGKPTDAVWMRSTLGKSAFVGGCNLLDGVSPEAVAAIYYQNANTTAVPTTKSAVSDAAINTCANDPLSASVPYYRITPDAKPPVTKELDITFQSNGTHNLWFVNNSTFRANYNDPILLEANLGNFNNFKPEYNVINFGDNSSIRIVVYNHALAGSHPFHYHGHNMHILAEGYGKWDGNVVNPRNPQRRDVHILHNAQSNTVPSYMVMQIEADNPGVWPFHCHVAWHMSGGLYVNAISYPKQIRKIRLPSTVAQTCRDWSAWSGENISEQIDSGL